MEDAGLIRSYQIFAKPMHAPLTFKISTFRRECKKFMNLISIGDGDAERAASLRLQAPERKGSFSEEKQRVKSVKLIELPTCQQLIVQHEMLQVRLPDVTAFFGCLDLKSRFPSSGSPGKAPKAEDSLPSWWDRHCNLQHTYGTCSLAVRLKESQGGKLPKPQNPSKPARCVDPRVELALELDASENELTDEAGARLISGLQRPFRLRVLKLHKNKVGDDTCAELANLVWHQAKAEIHLSHNEVQQRGLTAILAALAMHPEKAYPRETPCEDVPCWVRLEHNRVSHVEYVLALLRQALRAESEPETRKHAEAVLQSVIHQLQGERCKDTVSDSAAEDPERPDRDKAAEAAEFSDAAACRFEDLKVDATGAGLELTPDPYGFLIETVFETPGQKPGTEVSGAPRYATLRFDYVRFMLNAGEVILEIDGVQLWGDLDEDRLSDAFGSRFADGARMRVAPADAVRGRPLWQPLTIPGPGLSLRCEAVSNSLREDLKIMGKQCGVNAELEETGEDGKGPPQNQRWAADELPRLMAFYFPEASIPFPSCQWRGDAEDSCIPTPPETATGAKGGGAGFSELTSWEEALRGQWREDDDLFDEDLPVEPLEAPDDGPDVFEGEALPPEVVVTQPLRVLVLVGLPGSGKSTLASRLQKFGWVVINQDTLGDRKKCVAAANEALSSGKRIVVDRCNVTRLQRRVWLGVADENKASTACIWLDVPEEECGDRVLHRFGHSTLPADNSSLEVISAFQERFESPMEAEGFVMWWVRDDGDLDEAVVQLQELVERSEALAEETQPAAEAKTPYTRHSEAFPYKAFQRRGARALYLRALHSLQDKNLKQDWFFQEKIQEPPEPGWLELRWILCERGRCLGRLGAFSTQAEGCSWISVGSKDGAVNRYSTAWHSKAQTKPLPKLKEKRPAKGHEPEWYVMLHADKASPEDSGEESENEEASGDGDNLEKSKDREVPTCVVCRRQRPKTCFSKAQLTKHRRTDLRTAGSCTVNGRQRQAAGPTLVHFGRPTGMLPVGPGSPVKVEAQLQIFRVFTGQMAAPAFVPLHRSTPLIQRSWRPPVRSDAPFERGWNQLPRTNFSKPSGCSRPVVVTLLGRGIFL
eukprot:s1968_g7.t3